MYLLTEVEAGPEGEVRPSDCVKGVNLTRQVDMSGPDAFYTSNARDLVQNLVQQPPPYRISCHIGGPVQPTVPLATYATRASAAREGDLSDLMLVAAASGQSLWVGRLSSVLEFANLDAEAMQESGRDNAVKIYCGHAVWSRSVGRKWWKRSCHIQLVLFDTSAKHKHYSVLVWLSGCLVVSFGSCC